jgi:long-chain fatty acid transport protein
MSTIVETVRRASTRCHHRLLWCASKPVSRILCRTLVPAVILGACMSPALASSFALREGSTDWMANAFAGEAAKAYDASTAFSNPAGMTRLNRNETDLSFSVVAPSSSFSGTNTIGGQITPGSQGGDYAHPFVVPSTFSVWNATPDLKFGAALSAPFGARLAYPQDFVGRYQSVVSRVSDVQITLAAAYRINEHLSIGGGPVINFLSARFTRAVNLGRLSSTFGDPIAEFKGSNVGAGFALGALYEFDDSFRVGIVYHSRIAAAINGSQSVAFSSSIGVASPATAAALSANTGPASARLTLPDSVKIGFYKELDDRWSVMADLEWTDWSLVNASAIVSPNRAPATVFSQNWRNTWFGAIGASFRPIKKLLIQGGIGYDMSPVTSDNRTPRVPDADRFLVGAGITYGLFDNVNVQFAILEVLTGGAQINNFSSATAGTIRGTYHSRATVVGVGMAARF